MINTYQTSSAPPPVPPRLSRSHSVLIPHPPPSQGHSKALIRFLVGVVLLQLFLTVGGLICLYYRDNMGKRFPAEGKAAFQSSQKQETSYKALARMVVEQRPEEKSTPGYLQWNIDHSILRDVNYYHNIWLTVLQPGDYYVYSRVTFSKGHPNLPLASRVRLRKNETEKDKTVMQASCYLDSQSASVPRLCTASQVEVLTLEKGNQLSVWVQDLSLVDYEETATTFGMYKL